MTSSMSLIPAKQCLLLTMLDSGHFNSAKSSNPAVHVWQPISASTSIAAIGGEIFLPNLS